MRTRRMLLAGPVLFVAVLPWFGVACNSSGENEEPLADVASEVAGDTRLGLDADEVGIEESGGDDQTEPKDIEEEAVLVKLVPEEYTNEPILVGQSGMGFQFDSIVGAVQVVKDDDRCAILHGQAQTVLVDTYKVTDGKEDLGLDGVKLVTYSHQFELSQGETLFGNEQALQASSVAVGGCPKVLVEESNTLFEGDYFEEGGCKIPFIADGVTYMAVLGNLGGCAPYEVSPGDDLYLFSRYIEESDLAYVIVPVFVKNGEVWSPCVPLNNQSVSAFEAQLEGLL